MKHAFVPLSMLLKILSLFSPHLSEFWVKKSIILPSFPSVIIVSSISNDNVDEAVNVEMSCGLYPALVCYSSINASTLKVLRYELYVYICVEERWRRRMGSFA